MRIKQATTNHSPAVDTAIRVLNNASPYDVPAVHGRECLEYKAFNTYGHARRYAGHNGVVLAELVEGFPPIKVESPFHTVHLRAYGLCVFNRVFVGVKVTR